MNCVMIDIERFYTIIEQNFEKTIKLLLRITSSLLLLFFLILVPVASIEKLIGNFVKIYYLLIYLSVAVIFLFITKKRVDLKKIFNTKNIILFLFVNFIAGVYYFTPEYIFNLWYDWTEKMLFYNALNNFSKSILANALFVLIARPWLHIKERKPKKTDLINLIITIILWGYIISTLFYISPLSSQGIE